MAGMVIYPNDLLESGACILPMREGAGQSRLDNHELYIFHGLVRGGV